MFSLAQASGVDIRKSITPSDVHVNRPMTNISLAAMQSATAFVSDRIFPRVPVMKQSDLFFYYPSADWNRDEMKLRAPSTETAGGGYNIETKPYYAPVWGVHRDVDDQLRANADEPINVDREATMWVTQKGLIRREVEFATKYFQPGAWTNVKTGVGTGPVAGQFLQWNDAASEPVKDVKMWMDEFLLRNGVPANVLLLGHETYTALTENDAIIDRIKYGQTPGQPAMVTRQALAALFGIDRIEVMSAIVNTAKEGAAVPVNRFIGASKGALLVHAAPSPGLMTPSAGYSFVWAGYAGAGEYGQRISSFRIEPIRSDRFEMELAFTHEKVSDDLGTMILDAIA